MAKTLKCTVGTIYRCIKCVGDPAKYEGLRWGRGRPLKVLGIKPEEVEWLCSRETLIQQAGIPLTTRVKLANDKFQLNLKLKDLRQMYKSKKITLQKLYPTMKPGTRDEPAEQLVEINKMKEEFKHHVGQRRHMIAYDAATFSVNHYHPRHWAPAGEPLTVKQKKQKSQLVCVFCAISVEKGKVHWYARKQSAFDKFDTLSFFKGIISKDRYAEAPVLFGDNSSIHKNDVIYEWAEANADLMWSVRYRPQSQG